MIKNLLVDRFKLVLRRETKEMPVHVIAIAKGGPNQSESADRFPVPVRISAVVMVPTGTRSKVASGKTVDDLAAQLSEPNIRLGPVLDKTGLTKKYDREPSAQHCGTKQKPPACAGGSSLHSWGNLAIEQQQ